MLDPAKKYNKLLVEFEFIVDLDLAMVKLIKDKYNNKELVNQDLINTKDENKLISVLINREHINPLELLMPKYDTTNLYNDLISNHMNELLEYAKAYDTFSLMITFLREASSISITILCNTKEQSDFIKKLNPMFNTIISSRKDIVLSDYTVLYIKYYAHALEYINLNGKHVYIAKARFNMDSNKPKLPLIPISAMVSDINIIHLMDLYTKIKMEEVNQI